MSLETSRPDALRDQRATRLRRVALVIGGLAVVVLVALLLLREFRRARLWASSEQAARAGRWEDAERDLARMAWYAPLDREALSLRARAAMERGDRELAAECLGRIPPSAPDAAAARLTQGRLLQELFRVGAAETAYRKALAIDQKLNEARRALIGLLGIQRRTAEQEAEIWSWHDRAGPSERLEALRLLAEGVAVIPPETLARNVDEGAVLERCIESEPGNAYTIAALAAFRRQRGDIQGARALVELPTTMNVSGQPVSIQEWIRPSNWSPLDDEWIACQIDEGRYDEVRPFCETPPPDCPPNSTAFRYRLSGDWMMAQNRFDEAVNRYREALRREPRDPSHHYRLGQALRAAGQDAEAVRELEAFTTAQELKAVVGRISDQAPEPELLAKAAELCRVLGRQREANAWATLAQRFSTVANRAAR
jgi:tetratricopeptide (TPR) repeat protein